MISDLTVRFDNALKAKFKDKTDIQNYLLKHERKNLCIQNLCEQIIRAEKYSINISLNTYDGIIKDIAMMFAKACLQKAEESHYSQAKINQIKAQQDHLKQAEEMLHDLEKETLNDKGLTEIERDNIRQAIASRSTD